MWLTIEPPSFMQTGRYKLIVIDDCNRGIEFVWARSDSQSELEVYGKSLLGCNVVADEKHFTIGQYFVIL